MTSTKPDPPEERHRRMAAEFYSKTRPAMIGVEEAALAQLVATVDRDAFARGVEAVIGWLLTERDGYQKVSCSIREALLPEPPRTGAELAAEHGFQKLAESGAARVAAVSDDGCACLDEENSGGVVRRVTRDCPVHGTKGGER